MTAPAFRLHDTIGDEIERLAATVKPIDGARGIMLAGSADGTSGATARLFGEWQDKSEPAIVFTGYVNPTTPADRLVKSGRAQFMRWNVHPRLSDTVALVRATQAKTVIPAFCDRSQLAALAAAFAPARVTMDERDRVLADFSVPDRRAGAGGRCRAAWHRAARWRAAPAPCRD